jgi:hypothetical protein
MPTVADRLATPVIGAATSAGHTVSRATRAQRAVFTAQRAAVCRPRSVRVEPAWLRFKALARSSF